MIVVDACAWVQAMVDDTPTGDAAREVLSADQAWTAPAHMPVEVLRTLRRGVAAERLSRAGADRLAAEVADAEVSYAAPHARFLGFVWQLQDAISLYDAPYVALAVELGVPLVTVDRRLATAARALGVEVVVPGESSSSLE